MTKLLQETLGHIVGSYPQAAKVLENHKIDYCCGGNRLLESALAESPSDNQQVIQELTAAIRQAETIAQANPADLESEELIEYVITTHHGYLNRELPVISQLLTAILRAHGVNHPELKQVHRLFHELKMELEQHLIKEEEILFPAIKGYLVNPDAPTEESMLKTMLETEDEHEVAGGIIKELQRLTSDYLVPEDGCGTYQAAYEKLHEFQLDLFQHIHLENNILFPRFTERP